MVAMAPRSTRLRPRHATSVAAAAAVLPLLAEASYTAPPCGPAEVQGEVEGAAGYVCAPRCGVGYTCPLDVPGGAAAQATCMLQDIKQDALCGLLCQVDAQCPSGSQCKQLRQVEVGICLYPVSFADWASSQSKTQKLAVGLPKGGSQQAPADFMITKTFTALQNIKSRYAIDDGDADMLTLKELLNSMTVSKAPAGGPVAPAALLSAAPQSPDSLLPYDVQRFEGYAAQGLPGFQREIHDTVWNVEHLDRRMAATNLLSGLLWLVAIYLVVGSFLKFQQGSQGIDLVPHIGFWCEYPRMVNDGVKYSKILLGIDSPSDQYAADSSGGLSYGVHNRSGGVGSFDPL